MTRRRSPVLPRPPFRRRSGRTELDRAASDAAWNARLAYQAWRDAVEEPPAASRPEIDVDPSEIADAEAFEAFLASLGPAVPRRGRIDH